MRFTDRDLRRLKKDLDTGDWKFDGDDLLALVARLDAAEDLILHHSITPIGYDHRYEAWQKAAGKI